MSLGTLNLAEIGQRLIWENSPTPTHWIDAFTKNACLTTFNNGDFVDYVLPSIVLEGYMTLPCHPILYPWS